MRHILLGICWVILMMKSEVLAGEGKDVIAPHGMVATTHKRAVQIGVDILKHGGNAVDAAIATNAAMGVVEPMSCGLGGDLYAMVWDAKTQKLYALNASGRSPYASSIAYYQKHKLTEIPTTGPLSWSVPGAVDGWDQLRQKFGTMSWEQLLTPAIDIAERGAEVPPTIGAFFKKAESTLLKYPDSTKTYLVNGRHAPNVGDVFKNPQLAASYREIVRGGRDAFYKGRIAAEIADFSQKNGGLFSLRDFADHTSTWVDPVSTTYRGVRVWEIPPPGQGISVLQMLNLIEPFDIKSMGAGSADWCHLFVEAKRLAYADRAKYYTDPNFARVPVAQLISKEYAKQRQRIDMKRAAPSTPPGEVALGGDTIYLTVVDKDRNCVSLIQSNYSGFGSGMAAGNLGFVIQNRGCLFALDPAHANRLEPHRRPFHTIIPAMVTRDDKPWFCFGVMGGDMQPQGHVQVLVNLLDFGMNIQQAGDAPRVEHVGSATPTGKPEAGVGTVEAEQSVDPKVIEELRRRGQHVRTIAKNGGGYQGILIDWENGELHGASESRRDGQALGY
jgi:gamma-glutamyltranspeptidase/glutathione hydrolase